MTVDLDPLELPVLVFRSLNFGGLPGEPSATGSYNKRWFYQLLDDSDPTAMVLGDGVDEFGNVDGNGYTISATTLRGVWTGSAVSSALACVGYFGPLLPSS